MTLILLLFSIGILFIAIEVFVPGAIIGTIGALFMFGGCFVTFMFYDTAVGLVATMIALLVAAFVLFLEFRILPKTKFGKRAFLTAEVTGVSAALGKDAQELVGKFAVALTLLSPSGYVNVDGQRYEAFCQSGQALVGSQLKIIGADNFRLIVTQYSPT